MIPHVIFFSPGLPENFFRMIFPILAVCCFFLLVLASQNDDQKGQKRRAIALRRLTKRLRTEDGFLAVGYDEISSGSWDFLVNECQFLVLWALVDTMPLDVPSVAAYISSYKSVCTACNAMLNTIIYSHPRASYVELCAQGWVVKDVPKDLRMLRICKPLLSIEAVGEILLNSQTEKVFEVIHDAPAFSEAHGENDVEDLVEGLLQSAFDNEYVDIIMFPVYEDDDSEDEEIPHIDDIATHISEQPTILLEIPKKDVLFYLFLDNILAWHRMDIFQISFMRLFVEAYNDDCLDKVIELRDLLAKTILPRTKVSALFSILKYAVTAAAFFGKRDFLQWLKLDYAALKKEMSASPFSAVFADLVSHLDKVEAYEKGETGPLTGSLTQFQWMKNGTELLESQNEEIYFGWDYLVYE